MTAIEGMQLKVKEDHHARPLLGLDGNGGHCRGCIRRRHFGLRPADIGPDSGTETPWGEPDLQGIWTDETDTPLQRSPKFATQEFFTPAQRAELDKERSALLRRDRRVERGTELDVAGAYNDVFTPKKRTGTRTSRIVDPPNGRLPPL